ncbi:hypothetical protein BDFG_01995 [Blastomyces dermatitidis ATCC 26199]|nr:hypothetical protein BDFG_01995 [Blastomyces dermatitidis ATCC 26199]
MSVELTLRRIRLVISISLRRIFSVVSQTANIRALNVFWVLMGNLTTSQLIGIVFDSIAPKSLRSGTLPGRPLLTNPTVPTMGIMRTC